jgi:hypothetical protein
LTLCLHCGCGEPSNRHGNADSITLGDLHKAMGTAAHKEGGKGVTATARETSRMTRRHGRQSAVR